MGRENISTKTLFKSRLWSTGKSRAVPRAYSCISVKQSSTANPVIVPNANQNRSISILYGNGGPDWNLVYNKAYSNFCSKLGPSLMMGTNLIELSQTIDLISASLRAVRKPLYTMAKALQGAARGKRNNAFSQVANAYLAFQFGVKPLIADIHSLVQLISDPIPPIKVVGVGISSGVASWDTGSNRGALPVKRLVRLQSTVSISNPNLYLLNRIGLLNPASIAWEAVPFSFLVDWFYPIGQLASSITDLAGLALTNSFCTQYASTKGVEERAYSNPATSWTLESDSFYVNRTLEVPSWRYPAISLGNVKGSLHHLTIATALLQQQLGKRGYNII